MATVDNAAIVREAYEAFNKKDMDRSISLNTADCKRTIVPFNLTLGIRDYFKWFATAFPDGRIDVTSMVTQGDKVMVEFIGRGTHSGPLDLPTGKIAATNRKVELQFVETHELRNGKIIGGKCYFDAASLMVQLGLGQKLQPEMRR